MSNPRTPAPDPVIASLFEAERRSPGPPDAVRDEVLARVLRSVSAGPGGGGSGGPRSAPQGAGLAVPKGAVALGAAVVAFGVAALLLRQPLGHKGAMARPAPAVAPIAALPAAPPAPSEIAAAPQAASMVDAAAARMPPAARRPVVDDLGAERAVLDAARAALGRRDPTAALAAVENHRRRWARGALAEEREAMRVQALSLAHRTKEARAAADAFQRRYPASLFRGAIDATLEGGGE